MNGLVVLATVAVFASVITAVSASTGQIRINGDKNIWNWELLESSKTVLKSGDFDSKSNAVRSAVALLANGGDKERCKAVLIGNSNAVAVGTGPAVADGQEDVESDKQYLMKIDPKTVDCEKIAEALDSVTENFVNTHSQGKAIGETDLTIDIAQIAAQQFSYVWKGRNGEIVLRSEQYQTRDGAKKGIVSVLLNGGVKSSYEIKANKNNQWYFNVKASNSQIVGASETYKSQEEAQRGLEGVKDKVRKILKAIVDNDDRPVQSEHTTSATPRVEPTSLQPQPAPTK